MQWQTEEWTPMKIQQKLLLFNVILFTCWLHTLNPWMLQRTTVMSVSSYSFKIMMTLHVFPQGTDFYCSIWAKVTGIWFFPSVSTDMGFHVILLRSSVRAMRARIRSFTSVNTNMVFDICGLLWGVRAVGALMYLAGGCCHGLCVSRLTNTRSHPLFSTVHHHL